MKIIFTTLVVFASCGIFLSAHAFPVPAHSLMTRYAVRDSVLYDEEFIEYLGILETYRKDEISNETDEITISIDENDWQAVDVLVRNGAVKEDSVNPPKMLHHFYDVQNGGAAYSGLGPGGALIVTPIASKVWALEANGPIDDWLGAYDQDFSYNDALNYFEETFSGNNLEERNRNFGLTLSTMGHIVHHIQDMAQPEHSRNDNHFDTENPIANFALTAGENSIVETVSHSLFEGTVKGDIKSSIVDPYTNDKYQRIDIRKFDNPGDFWSTDGSAVDVTNNYGIAAYSSRNYITEETNFIGTTDLSLQSINNFDPRMNYPFPDGKGMVQGTKQIVTSDRKFIPITHYGNQVIDNYDISKSFFNDSATAVSALYKNIPQKKLDDKDFMYTGWMVKNAVRDLTPKAISYSTAIIDYFFRGQIEIEEIRPTSSTTGVLVVKNESGKKYTADGDGSKLNITDGLFRVFLDNRDGERLELESLIGPIDILHGDLAEIPYDLNRFVSGNNANVDESSRFTLLFRGNIGVSEAVTGTSIDRDATFIVEGSHGPDSSFQLSNERGYKKLFLEENARFSYNLPDWNIDWKGGYMSSPGTNSRIASKTVSFAGPTARFLGKSGYSDSILVNGKHVFRTSGIVLGAALRPSQNGYDELLAMVYDESSGTQSLIIKPYLNTSNFDRSFVPYGQFQPGDPSTFKWEKYDTSFYPIGDLISPWFFNGSGTEASTLRKKTTKLSFDSNLCEDLAPGAGFTCETNNGHPAGKYSVTVLNQYHLTAYENMPPNVSDKSFETGDEALLAVDYLEDELLLLKIRNYDFFASPHDKSRLYVNDEPLLKGIYDCIDTRFANVVCPGVDDLFISLDDDRQGLYLKMLSESKISLPRQRVFLHLSYLDLRTKTFEYNIASFPYASENNLDGVEDAASFTSDYSVSHNEIRKKMYNGVSESVSCDPLNPDNVNINTLGMSVYGKAAFQDIRLEKVRIQAHSVRGQYSGRSECLGILPSFKTIKGVDRHGTFLVSGKFPSSDYRLNYISSGDNLNVLGFESLGENPPTSLVVR